MRAIEGNVDGYEINVDRIPVLPYPCTEQGILDAVTAGGAALIDCAVPTTVGTTAPIFFTQDLILMGGGNLTVDGQSDHRVFVVGSGVTVELVDLTVTGGAEPAGSGAGILNHGTLTRCAISANVAAGSGGGVSSSGSLTVRSSTVSGNIAGSGSAGGGIFTDGSSLSVRDSTVSGNSAGWGGGTYQLSGATTILNSTVSGNVATTFSGGGLANQALAPGTSDLTVRNSTISGNSAADHGDGIYNVDSVGTASLTLFNATVSGNAGSSSGSSIYDQGSLGSLVFETSLIDGACVITDVTPNAQFTMESPGATCGLPPTGAGNQVGVSAAALSLGPLQDNGGPTWTHAPAGSAAIDQIPAVNCMNTDQRGVARPQGADCEFGALEVTVPGSVFACTEEGIRDAIAAGIGPYVFDCVVPTTVTTAAEIVIDKDVILDGEGLLTVDGNNDHRVFSVPAGVETRLFGMTITGGGGVTNGGGICNAGSLVFQDGFVSGNDATYGGGIYNAQSGTLGLGYSDVASNSALQSGGGVYNENGAGTTVVESFVDSNTAGLDGAGVFNQGGLSFTHSYVDSNTATRYGGAIHNDVMGSLSMDDSIIAFNSALSGGGIYNAGSTTLWFDTLLSR